MRQTNQDKTYRTEHNLENNNKKLINNQKNNKQKQDSKTQTGNKTQTKIQNTLKSCQNQIMVVVPCRHRVQAGDQEVVPCRHRVPVRARTHNSEAWATSSGDVGEDIEAGRDIGTWVATKARTCRLLMRPATKNQAVWRPAMKTLGQQDTRRLKLSHQDTWRLKLSRRDTRRLKQSRQEPQRQDHE
ncbi:hypothetical protein XENOCAPTIV_017685 [Xenoophorus captivus]|uniref:Uncharacterized protein n=1 Tax=Xenoophorus captivus TaxID=1517983 RepID=A0ABV0S8K6_9TELE